MTVQMDGLTKVLLFRELKILFTSLSEKERKDVQVLCRQGGGHVVSSITPNDPPHVVVTRRVGSPKYCSVLRKHPMTPVVSPEWMKASVEQKKRLPYAQFAVGPCYGLKICLSGFHPEEKAKLAGFVEKNGGTHSPSLTKHCTHLVSSSKSSEKYVFAEKQGIVCASVEWLLESIRGGWCKDTSSYPVKDDIPGQSMVFAPKEKTAPVDASREEPERECSPHASDDVVQAQTKDVSSEDEDDESSYLDHIALWAVGCSLDETVQVLKLCRKSGAKRLTFGHPSLITHVLRGSSLNSLESREVSKYIQDRGTSAPPVVNIEWLKRSVARRESMPVDERFMVSVNDVQSALQSDKLETKMAPQSLTNEYSNMSESVGRKYDGFFAGYYFTLCAVRGTSEECVAEALIRRHGGKIFNSSFPASETKKRVAICPPSMKPLEINRLRSQNNNFASVSEENRFTLYWLRCCAEANQILAHRKGSPCFRPLSFELPMDGAEKLSVAISGYDKPIRSAIKHTVETIGGKVSLDCMSAKDSHLLVPYAHGEKYKHSARLGVKPVTADWLVRSVEAGRILPEAQFVPVAKDSRQPDTLEEGPGLGKIDATQHPWSKGMSQLSKDEAASQDARGLSRDRQLHQEKKRKLSMPSLDGILSMDPAKSAKEGQDIENRATDSNGKADEVLRSQNHSSKTSRDDELAQAKRQVNSLVSKLNQATDDGCALFPDIQDGVLPRGERTLTKQYKRSMSRSIERRQGLRSSIITETDEFDISQRVGYGDS